MHHAPFPRSSAVDLPPFAWPWVLPIPIYYDGSVTVGFAPGRPSRVPVVLHVRARRRCPIHPLQCARCTSPIMRRVRTAKLSRHAHDGAAVRRGRGACEVPPLEIGVGAMQLSPYRTGLAGRPGTRLPVAPAFPPCSCPLWLSPSGKSMTQESPFELLLTVSRMQHRVPRRPVSLHSARASQRPCDGPVSSVITCWLHDTTEQSMPLRGR